MKKIITFFLSVLLSFTCFSQISSPPESGVMLGVWNVKRYQSNRPRMTIADISTISYQGTWVRATLTEEIFDPVSGKCEPKKTSIICPTDNTTEGCYKEERFYDKYK